MGITCDSFQCIVCCNNFSCFFRVSICACKNIPWCLKCWSDETLLRNNVCTVCKISTDAGFPWWLVPVLNRGTAWFRARCVTDAFKAGEVVSEFCHICFISLHAVLMLALVSVSYLYPNPILIMPLLALQAVAESLCWSRSSSITLWAVALPAMLLFYPLMILQFYPFIIWLAASRIPGWLVDVMLLFAIRHRVN